VSSAGELPAILKQGFRSIFNISRPGHFSALFWCEGAPFFSLYETGKQPIFSMQEFYRVRPELLCSGGRVINSNEYTRASPSLFTRRDTISHATNPKRVPARATDRLHEGAGSGVKRYLPLVLLTLALIVVPASAEDLVNASAFHEPAVVHIGVYGVNFNRFSVEEGTVETNFYVTLK
jgi:hypothetical protein